MSGDLCGECGELFIWDADAGSGVCLNCGTLQDPSQTVLASPFDTVGEACDQYGHAFLPRPTTLKSIRNAKDRWDLAGQGKAAYAERSKIAMRHYTAALANRLGQPGLFPRAQLIFDQAMQKGNFRYGRKARLMSGAAIVIALREAHKGETLRDISYLLDDSPISLARVLTTVINLLQLRLPVIDASWHIPALQKQMHDVLAEHPSSLPPNLKKFLKAIHIPSAARTAASLADLVLRACLFSHAPSPPTACAVFILALEGEVLSSLPNCAELAKALGRRFGVSKDVIMRRYKVIYEEVEKWSENVPWLRAGTNGSSASGKKAPKAAKRVVIARALKDVVQFSECAWKAGFEAQPPPAAPDDDIEANVSLPDTGLTMRVDTAQAHGRDVLPRPGQRKRSRGGELDTTSQFLLAPLSTSTAKRAKTDATPALDTNALAHLLTGDSSTFGRRPTRLQLLCSEKRSEDIGDDELFGIGELDGLMRSEDEMEALMHVYDWARDDGQSEAQSVDSIDGNEGHAEHARRRDRLQGGTTRVNIEALNRLLAQTEADDNYREPYYDDDEDWEAAVAMDGVDATLAYTGSTLDDVMAQAGYSESQEGRRNYDKAREGAFNVTAGRSTSNIAWRSASMTDNIVGRSDEEVGPWRPISPGGIVQSDWDAHSQYDDTQDE